MSSEEISLVLSHRPQIQNQPIFPNIINNPNSNLSSFHPTTTTTNDDNNKTTRELTGFIEHHQTQHFQDPWTHRNGPGSTSPSSDSDDDEDDDVTDHKNITNPGNDGDVKLNENANANDQYHNAITVADPTGEMYYSQYLQGVEGSGSGAGFKETLVENGPGFSGRKDGSSTSAGSGESLRAILSDPLTGALMDDAMILPCGHSFGCSGMEHVMRMKACYTCSHPVSDGAVAPNLSLRSAVHAFRREEDSPSHRASKKRFRSEQDRSNYGEPSVDHSRGRGVQYPFSVHEHVIIQGNKRTPPRFVGRKAVVTTQCLNGWYVVKTLDNAESVKLQYRSLAKIQDPQPLNVGSSKLATPNWL